jgi:hypothetical protein
MLGVKVTILRYISDDPQPGIVECQLEDANGKRWLFVEKTGLVISPAALDSKTSYPQPGLLGCGILQNWRDTAQPEIVSITTSRPCYVDL